jgi:DNA (cytosine-5)-methyltransferase 1
MKILNLYAGIGGNRKLWGNDHEITAVEWDGEIAEVYSNYFPKDHVIVGDAHDFLLKNYKDFDFIWSSPPCPSHSDIRRCGVHRGQYEAIYPDMTLYQEVIFLKHFAPIKTNWVVENVIPYYEPLICPTKKMHRHLFWSNFKLGEFKIMSSIKLNDIKGNGTAYGFNISKTNIKNKRKSLRNMVNPHLSLYILNCAIGKMESLNVEQLSFI